MSEIAIRKDRTELVKVLESSLYPGAQPQSIEMVLGYCEAAGLDPMLKPVHIVPLWDSKAGRMRDVVMPGVGLYRTQASRTGQFAGMTEPEFGPDVTKNIGGQEVTFPEWCRVTVRRALPSGIVAEFTASEYWVENYAVKGGKEKSIAPNAMWSKRPRGQIAKCASAQALRIAFPELGSAPTADEMEGKALDPNVIENPPQAPAKVVSDEMLKAAEDAANKGMNTYRAWWKTLSGEQREAMQSSPEHENMKKRANEADARATAQAEPPESWADRVSSAADKETADAIMERAIEALGADLMAPVNLAYEQAWV